MDDLLKALENRDRALSWLKVVISREYTMGWLYMAEYLRLNRN